VPNGRAERAREFVARGEVDVPSITMTYPIKGNPPVLSAAGSAHESSTVVSRTVRIVGPADGGSGGVAIAVESVLDHNENGPTPSTLFTGTVVEYGVVAADAIAEINDGLTLDVDAVPAISLIANTLTLYGLSTAKFVNTHDCKSRL
jgi:hypothetical protein